MIDDVSVEHLWSDSCTSTGAEPGSLGPVEHFGDTPEMSDELLALVLDGTKRATAALSIEAM